MTQPTDPPTTEPQDGPPAPTAPPWGTDDQFDPTKAWSLIQNLRGDVDRQKARVAELTPYQQRVQEIEDAQKTEIQKATERAEAAEAQVARFQTEKQIGEWKAEVARATGVPVAALRGSTAEELAAHAAELLAAFPTTPPPAARTPIEALRPGALPGSAEVGLGDQIAAAEKAGDWQAVITLKRQLAASTKN